MPRLNSIRQVKDANGKVQTFILSEKLEDYRTAALAQAEYWAEGFCCRKEIDSGVYLLWVGPERKRKVKLLEGEVVTRQKGSKLWRVS